VTPELEAVAAALARAPSSPTRSGAQHLPVGGPAAVSSSRRRRGPHRRARGALGARRRTARARQGLEPARRRCRFRGVVVHLSGGFAWFDHLARSTGPSGSAPGPPSSCPSRPSVRGARASGHGVGRRRARLGGRGRAHERRGHGSDTAASLVTYRWLDSPRAARHRRVEHLGYGYAARRGPERGRELGGVRPRRGDEAAGREELRSIVRWRREHQPGEQRRLGLHQPPVTRPVGSSTSRPAGYRSDRPGSEKHANFIQADDGGARTTSTGSWTRCARWSPSAPGSSWSPRCAGSALRGQESR